MKLLNLILPLFLLQSCKAQENTEPLVSNPNDNSLLWELSGNGLKKPSYIFGTFHLMCSEDIRFSKQLNQALRSSDEVYFEMDLDDPSNTLGAMLFMNMNEGKKLKDLYTQAEYNKLETFFRDSIKMPLASMQRMKPGMLGSLLYPKLMPCKNMSGIEMELLKIATQQKKEVKGFETIAEQAAVFDSIPYAVQAQELLKTVDSFNFYRKDFDSLLNVYKSQQLSAIENLMLKSEFSEAENKDVMLDNRNRNWIKQLKGLLPSKSLFIAVGAGHLVGDNGLISLLKKGGYTLRPLLNK